MLQEEVREITLDGSASENGLTADSRFVLQRIAAGDRAAVDECTRIHGHLIWDWSRKFTDSTQEAETAARDIFADILDSAKVFDSMNCSETTFIKQICIRRLMGSTRPSGDNTI